MQRGPDSGTIPPRTGVIAAVCGLVAGVALPLLLVPDRPVAAEPGDGTVTVRVVREVNGNGTYDALLEPGIPNVTVRLTDDADTSIEGKTAADGTITLDPSNSALIGGKYRVEVVNPQPGVLYSAFADRTGLAGAPGKLSSTEEFVDLSGGKSVSYTTALWNPGDYCQQNAPVATACIRSDVPAADTQTRTLVTFPYNANGDNNQVTNLSDRATTGALYGIGYRKQDRVIFSGAFAKRGSNYGPGGSGAIYRTDRTTGQTTVFTTVPGTGTTPHNQAVDMDLGFVPAVGKEGLGDVDVTEDGTTLLAVNLADKSLYRYDAAQPTASAPIGVTPIPDPGCPSADDWRPFGLGTQDGVVFVGGVCSGQSTGNKADMRAVVHKFDPVAGTFGPIVLDQPLNFPRGLAFNLETCKGNGWYTWADTYRTTQDGITCTYYIGYPQPMLTDIVQDTNGDLILGFRDRFADQFGQDQDRTPGPAITLTNPAAGGDLNRACPNAAGTYVLDGNGGCVNNATAANNGGQAANVREYYPGDHRATYHQEAAYGGITLSKVESTLLSQFVDPIDITYSGGPGRVDRVTGQRVTGQLGNLLTRGFGKGGGMADLEVLCDLAPLQIGNRVWYDVNKDGVQDPAEKPVPGVTVRLYNSSGALVATTTTTARGEYYFDNSNVPGGLLARSDYVIKVDLESDYDAGGPLDGWVVTPANQGSNDAIDSDGVVPAGGRFPEHAVTTGGPGQNNHTYDFGYHQAQGRVHVVKVADGTTDPLPGAKFQLWQETNGQAGLQTTGTPPDTAVGAECTTDDQGRCDSDMLDQGTYYWQETAPPPGYLLPDPAITDPMVLTADNLAEGVTATVADQPEPTTTTTEPPTTTTEPPTTTTEPPTTTTEPPTTTTEPPTTTTEPPTTTTEPPTTTTEPPTTTPEPPTTTSEPPTTTTRPPTPPAPTTTGPTTTAPTTTGPTTTSTSPPPNPATSPAGPPAEPPETTPPPELGRTGFSVHGPLPAAVVLLVLGAVLIWAARRRHRQ